MDKRFFRQSCLKKLRKNAHRYNRCLDAKVALRINEIVRSISPRSILFYLPMSLEVNLWQLMYSYRRKYKIFVPFIGKESFKMVKYRLPLVRSRYGILQPRTSHVKSKTVDLIIVPVIGVDGACKRVGFGKGMYDRYYHKLKKKPLVLFVQRIKCYTRHIVTDDYDIAADYYITPEETLYRGRKYDNRNRHRPGRGRSRCRYHRTFG